MFSYELLVCWVDKPKSDTLKETNNFNVTQNIWLITLKKMINSQNSITRSELRRHVGCTIFFFSANYAITMKYN